MAELIMGQAGTIQWITATYGTIGLNADFRTVNWNPSTAYEDVSAGNDTQVGRLPTLKDATASISLVGQTGGTQIAAAMQPGQAGTLIIGPEGTATNKRKITLPAYCDGGKPAFPYANVMTIDVGFSGSSVLGNFTDSVY
jgi:hypothetical protein